MPTTSPTASSSSSAAAIAQRKAEAERRAEAARQEAQRRAEAAAAQAAKAKQAQAEAVGLRGEVARTHGQLEQTGLNPEQRQGLRQRLGEQQRAYSQARRSALHETGKAQRMLADAEGADVEATGLSARANGAAEGVGEPAPFGGCDEYTRVESQNRKAFDQLFGSGAATREAEKGIGGLAAIDEKARQAHEGSSAEKAVALYDGQLRTSGEGSRSWSYADAAEFNGRLATLAEQHRDEPQLVKGLMTLAGPQLKRSAELLGQAAEDDEAGNEVEALTANLSRLGNAAPPEAAARLAFGLASAVSDHGELHQVDDGFGHFAEASADDRFRQLFVSALQSQGKSQAAEEVVEGDPGLVDSVGERFEDAGEGLAEIASDAFAAIKEGATDAFNFFGDQLNGLGDAIRHRAADLIDVDGRIAGLNKPGDSFTAHLDVEGNVLGADATAGVEMKVTRSEGGGYSMDLTGRGSLGVAEKLSIPGLEGGVSASATGEASVHFEFDQASQVTQGAETVAGIAIGSAVGGPLGTAITGGSATEEIGALAGHFESATVKVGVEGAASAGLGEKLGTSAASLGATGQAQVGVEINKAGAVTLLLDQSLTLDGSVAATGVPLPGGSSLAAGAQGKGSISLSTRIPAELEFSKLASDPLGALESAAQTAYDQATSTLRGNITLNVDDAAGDAAGVAVDLSATTRTRDLVGVLGEAFRGNLDGALGRLGKQAQVEGSIREYDARTTEIDAGVHVPVLGGVEIDGGVSSESSNHYRHFEGPASRLPQLVRGIGLRG